MPLQRRAVIQPSGTQNNTLLQRRLRFLMRLYIGCWIGTYLLFKKNTFVTDGYVEALNLLPSGFPLSPMLFIWASATLLALPLAAGYWLITREAEDDIVLHEDLMDDSED